MARQASSDSMPSASLSPPSSDPSNADDWTKVKDPKEKKRIQNRVAQRTYRHRMKARLGELQARLDSHERQSQVLENQTNGQIPLQPALSTTSMIGLTPSIDPAAITASSMGMAALTTQELDRAAMEAGVPSPTPTQSDSGHQISLMQSSMYEQAMDDCDQQMMYQPPQAHLMQSPPASNASPQPNGSASPEQPAKATKISHEFMMDCLRFQTQLLNRLNSLQQENAFPNGFGQLDTSLGQNDSVNMSAFASGQPDGMGFAFDPTVEAWKNDVLAQKLQEPEPPMGQPYFSGLSDSSPVSHIASGMMPHDKPSVVSLGTQASLDERFERIMQQAEAAGFESFDALVTAYYSENFSDASPLADEQRLSRNRRLPQVISDLFSATSDWSIWERRGFQEEILKTAEAMLISEGNSARHDIALQIAPILDSQEQVTSPVSPEALLAMKRTLQDKLPNSWALSMALAADNRSPWHSDRSNTALATTLLLNFAGRMPNDQLLHLIGSCL